MSFHPSYHFVGVSHLPLDTGYLFFVGSNILLLMVVQQLVVILVFLQEKMSVHPSTAPSSSLLKQFFSILFLNFTLASPLYPPVTLIVCLWPIWLKPGICLVVSWLKWKHSQQKSPKYSTWVQSQKWQNDLCSFPRQITQDHSNLSLCPNH